MTNISVLTRGEGLIGKLVTDVGIQFPDGTFQQTAAVSNPPVAFDSDQAVISAQVFG